jgi:cytoskeleton protein RodZ
MNESPEQTASAAVAPPAPTRPTTAGGLLRQARQAQGLHIAALAAAIKVVPRKLELLETDQFDQLPDATFTRALAQTVCRTLKVDAGPILALMPPPSGHRLEQVAEGLNTPFRERPGRLVPQEWARVASPALWLTALLLIAAAVVYLVPADWLQFSKPVAIVPPAADAPSVAAAPAAEPVPRAESPAASATADVAAPLAPMPPGAESIATALAPVAGVVQLSVTAPSWIEITDAHGQTLLARVLQTGENVGLDGVMPLKAKIGNASGTQLVLRGQPLDLAPFTRDNVARLDLK